MLAVGSRQATDSLLGQIKDFKLYSKELQVPLEIPQRLCWVRTELWMGS